MQKCAKEICKRFGAGFLAIVLLLSLMPTSFASAAYQDDYAEMIEGNHVIDALAYLGYDIDGLIKDKKLFQIYTGDAIKPYLTNVEWTNWNGTSGRETISAGANDVSVTGKIPNVALFERQGFDCGGFVTYYYYNYLVNIAGVDISSLTKRLANGANDPAPWVAALEKMQSKDNTAELMIDLADDEDSSNVPQSIWKQLTPGDLLFFKTHPSYNEDGSLDSEGFEYGHICIFIGMFPNKNGSIVPWMAHQSSSKGSCMVPVSSIENLNVDGLEKGNQTLNKIYHLKTIPSTYNPYGSITIEKTDSESGAALMGAKFVATNIETNEATPFPVTGADGKAKLIDLPLGTYIVKEVAPPTNYVATTQTWTVNLTKSNKDISIDITNKLAKGMIAAQKADEFGNPLSGVTFGIYSDAACEKQLGTMTTNELGVATSDKYDCTKTYYIKETKAQSSDYVLDNTVYSVVIAADATVWVNNGEWIINYLKNGAAGIKKVDEYGNPLAGVVYGVYKDADCKTLLSRVTTDLNGEAVYGQTANGDYTVRCRSTVYFKELTPASDDYVLDTNMYPVAIAAEKLSWANDGEAVVNYLKRGAAAVKKVGENGEALPNATFGAYSDSSCNNLLGIFVTDEKGIGTFGIDEVTGDYTVVCNTTIYIREMMTPDDTWVLDQTVYPVTIVGDKMTFANNGDPVVNKHKYWQITFQKKDSVNNGLIAGDASVVGAVYGLYNNNHELLDEYTVGKDGTFTTKKYVVGTGYYLQEISSPSGYILDTTAYYLDEYSKAEGHNNPLTMSTATLKEIVMTGTVSISKFTANPTYPGIYNVPETGAEFQVYLKSAGSYENAVATGDSRLYDFGTANAEGNLVWSNGEIVSKDLAYGTYVVHQVSSWDNRIFVEDFEITILDNSQHFDFHLNNPYYTANIVVNKRDAESGMLIVNGIAAFKILNLDTNKYVSYHDEETGEVIDEFMTVDGMMTLPMELPYGNYQLEETRAPEGYLLNSEPITFVIDKNSNGILTFNVENEPLMGKLQIDKKGIQFVSVSQKDTNYGPVFAPVYEEDFIAGVRFNVIADEDIVTGDGVVHYKKGDIVDTIVTNGDATVCSKDLYVGKYLLVEIEAPDGVIMTHDAIEIEVANPGQQKVSVTPVQITNDYVTTEVNMLKRAYTWETVTVAETGEVTRKLNMVSGVGFTFGLFATEDFTAKNGDLISGDSLVAVMVTNELGAIHLTDRLPYGKYYIKELDTPKDHPYIMDAKAYDVDLSVENSRNNVIVVDVNDGEAVINEFVNFSVAIKKTDLTSAAPVKGALVSIKNAAGDTIYSVYTDEEGKLPGILLEPGKYTFTEDIAPAGYIREPETFEFEVLADGTVEGTTEFTNEQTVIELFKVDKDTQEPLANAKIRVTNSTGEVVYEGVTDETGKITIVGVLNPGESYEFTEIETPNGYAITATVYSFTVNEDGTITGSNTVENEKTQFSIYKTSPDGLPLAGAEFTMYDVDGNVLDVQVTGEDGIATFTGFGVGTFIVRETKAPEGYELIEGDIVITNDGKWDNSSDMARFTFVNEPIPGTGDITMPTTIASIAMGFALFMLAACVIFFKKKIA